MSDITVDVSKGVENVEISLAEDVADLDHLTDFVYIRKNIPGPGTKCEPFLDEFGGCECGTIGKAEEMCSNSICRCLEQFGPFYKSNGVLTTVDPYQKHMIPIRECNKHCSCSENCTNRIVQLGVKKKLQVFDAKSKGLGLRTLEKINKNEFVCEYIGEVLTEKVAQSRFNCMKDTDSNYIFVLREYLNSGKVDLTIVDPTYIGNIGRFINHSCQPNLYMVPVRVDCNVPKLSLFALRDIENGEELSYDYSGELVLNNEEDSGIDKSKTNRKFCLCGSEACRGLLPSDETLVKV